MPRSTHLMISFTLLSLSLNKSLPSLAPRPVVMPHLHVLYPTVPPALPILRQHLTSLQANQHAVSRIITYTPPSPSPSFSLTKYITSFLSQLTTFTSTYTTYH